MPETDGPAQFVTPDTVRLRKIGIGALVAAGVVVAIGVASRIHATSSERETSAQASVPSVAVVAPSANGASSALVLPGSIQAYNSAAIYARTNGYVRRWLVDIGDKVGSGQTLAVLDAPELDQQLAQANADYQTALANERLAATTAKRWGTMLEQDAVSAQETDEKRGDLAAKSALANASLANVRRLRALQGFTTLTAPFAGVVTSRSAQIGQLVVSGTAASQPLFTVSDVRQMRIYVRVPQSWSAQVRAGMAARLTVPEFPDRTFAARVTRSADAVDTQSGSVLIQMMADNPDGALKAGAFAQVRFDLPTVAGSGLVLPGSTVLYANSGPAVAVVGAGDRVTVKPISIVRDNGATVVVSGVGPRDRVIDTPPDAVRTGDVVRVEAPAKGAAHGD
jgi:RND family efflux transporter MFP subunit